MSWIATFLAALRATARSRAALQAENLALRHQLGIYQRTCRRPRIRPLDRLFWSWLSRRWTGWREALVIVRPETVIAWQRRRFRDYWRKLSRAGKPGRPPWFGRSGVSFGACRWPIPCGARLISPAS